MPFFGLVQRVSTFIRPIFAGDGLRLYGGTSGYVGLKPAAAAGSLDFVLPSADGAAGEFLKTDGSKNLSFAAAGGGGALDGCMLRHASDYTLSNATWVALQFDTEDWDVGGMHDTSTNNTRIYDSGAGGVYALSMNISFSSAAYGTRGLKVNKNGSHYFPPDSGFTWNYAGNGGYQQFLLGWVGFKLAAGDYLEVMGYHDTGVDCYIRSTYTRVCMQKVSEL